MTGVTEAGEQLTQSPGSEKEQGACLQLQRVRVTEPWRRVGAGEWGRPVWVKGVRIQVGTSKRPHCCGRGQPAEGLQKLRSRKEGPGGGRWRRQ